MLQFFGIRHRLARRARGCPGRGAGLLLAGSATILLAGAAPADDPPPVRPKPATAEVPKRAIGEPWRSIPHRDLATPDGALDVVALSPDGDSLAIGSAYIPKVSIGDYDYASVWDLQAGRKRAAVRLGGLDEATALAFSGDGKLLAIGDREGNVVLWDLAAGQPLATLPSTDLQDSHQAVGRLRLDRDGRWLVAIPRLEDRSRVRVWDRAARREVDPWGVPNETMIVDVAFGPGGRPLVCCASLAHGPVVVSLYDPTARRSLWAYTASQDPVTVTLDGRGRRVMVLDRQDPGPFDPHAERRDVTFLDAATGRATAAFRSPVPIYSALLTDDGAHAAIFGVLGRGAGAAIFLLDAATGRPVAAFVDPGAPDPAAFSPGGRFLVTLRDEAVQVWRVADLLKGAAPPAK